MNRNFGIGILILCFSSSSVHLGWAAGDMDMAPIVVQPYEVQELNQQMMDRDRQNRDEEMAIKQLIEDNDKLTQATLAHQEDEGLAKINQTMLSYRDALLSRDRARIVANSAGWGNSRYGDLIALTEDADAMTVHRDLEDRSGLLAEKYQMLTQLKDEMTALNEKLRGKSEQEADQNMTTIDGFKKITQEQEDKIQLLTQRLGEMDKRIAKYDEIIAQKDQQIALLKSDASLKDETIKDQEKQIAILQETPKESSFSSTNKLALPPVIINSSYNQQAVPGANLLKEKQDQVDLLKSELEDKITELKDQGSKDEIVKQQEDQITMLKAEAQTLSSKGEFVKAQADQMAKASEQLKDQNAVYADVKNQVMALRNVIHQQDLDLQSKNDSIRWLNEVLSAAKNKAEYYKLTSQEDQMTVKQVQEEVQNIKADFARQLKDYDQFENAVGSLKTQVTQLGLQLSQKQNQVGLLKSQLEDKINQVNDQRDQIAKMKADIQRAHADDRLSLAKQLIDLQQQEASLLDEKSNLEADQNARFDQYAMALESKIKGLLAEHQIQTVDLENRMQELKNGLSQKEQQEDSLEMELKNKIAEEKDQAVLSAQIQDLKGQLQDKEDQIASMSNDIQEGQKTKEEADSLKQQLVAEQDTADQLKQQLDSKTAQADKMGLMIGDYQKKLEAKDNAYNEQLGQIADLNARLQAKKAQVVIIKKDMHALQEFINAKDRDTQAKDLSLSMIQQKAADDKINEYQQKINGLQATNVKQLQEITNLRTELALARQQLDGMPSSDEIDFLRAGLKKATLELSKKDAIFSQVKADADEYAKEFKEQTQEFQSLKDQLLDAQDQIQRKDEDIKYKDMAITRLKGLSRTDESGLKTQVMVLTQRLEEAQKELRSKTHENRVEVLQAQLKSANTQIKDLQARLDRLGSSSQNDPMEEKLKQALDKIDAQGTVISTLFQKLQDCGKTSS